MKKSEKWLKKCNQLIKDGYIRTARHPSLPLTIYNYTQKTQFEGFWNEYTIECRGLVLDDDGRIVIECPKKFFNHNEPLAPKIDYLDEAWVATDKLDGYYISIKEDSQYGLIITSRGSFDNKYVDAVKELFKQNHGYEATQHGMFEQDYSYFCELCQNFPEDEGIIVANHPTPKLVCWAVKDPDNTDRNTYSIHNPFPAARQFFPYEVPEYLKKEVEGVVWYNRRTGERVKMKTDWYLNMHKLIGNCTRKKVWEILSNGDDISEYPMPDEMMKQMEEWAEEYRGLFEKRLADLYLWEEKTEELSDKDLALSESVPQEYKSLLFDLRKDRIQRAYNKIWKMIL